MLTPILDFLARFPAIIAAIIGLPVGLLAWWTAHQSSKRQATKAEVDVIFEAAALAGNDEKYREFLLNIGKEKLLSMTFGCQITLDDIQYLMAYYTPGKTSIRKLSLAWPERRIVGNTLSFRLQGWKRAGFNFVRTYVWTCFAFAALLLVCLFLPASPLVQKQLMVEAVTFIWLAFGMAIIHRRLYVAHHLSKLES